ncbi:unnamed protein product, partial [marine sediment metagenome]
RRKRASRILRKRLKDAKKLLGTDTTKEFYAALSESLTKYIGDKLNIAVAGLTLNRLEEELERKNVSSDLINTIKELLSSSDFARFAPTRFNEEKLKSDYQSAEKIIIQLERFL